jgi:hypothetical protein
MTDKVVTLVCLQKCSEFSQKCAHLVTRAIEVKVELIATPRKALMGRVMLLKLNMPQAMS